MMLGALIQEETVGYAANPWSHAAIRVCYRTWL